MTLTLAAKKVVVEEVAQAASSAVSAVIADYSGLTVNQMTELRAKARAAKVYMRVVPNNLVRRAFDNTDFACLSTHLVGPLFIALSTDAPGDAARLLKDFSKDNAKLSIKALSLSGNVYGVSHLDFIASLPTREEALAKLLFVMKAPVEKFVRTLAEPYAKLVRVVAAVKDTKVH